MPRLRVEQIGRRTFLAVSAAAGAGWLLGSRLEAAPWKTTLHKAMVGVPSRELLTSWKAAGFEGIESTRWNVSPAEAAGVRDLAASLGMRIHSVLYGRANLNLSDAVVTANLAKLETALHAAQAYGANTLLMVPCHIKVEPTPKPWEFDLRFDPKTGRLQQVVAGNNTKYQNYIDAHNHAADAARKGLARLIPIAERAGVVLALENVWNHLWVKPDFFANFIASFQTPVVRTYFDIGNHVQYAPPQDWIRTLGKLIAKCHVKDFKLNPNGHGGDFCQIRDGSVDWPAVRQALDDVGYNGWMTIEDGTLPPPELSKRLDRILAGK
ncbi:MAG: sugar phosphate isomerase/epimerase [Planctomycetaceae bacterium]|nr:sugar phosphate isomerase/epimerase [Planctomycetaceae bacterium]